MDYHLTAGSLIIQRRYRSKSRPMPRSQRIFSIKKVLKLKTVHITVAMKKIENNYLDQFSKYITADNVRRKIEILKNAEPSTRPSLIAEICNMFESAGISCEEKKTAEYYSELLEKTEDKFMSFEDIKVSILQTLYDNFMDYPTPADYMKRLVDRLSDPRDHWENDTLRLRILKQFIKYGNYLKYKKNIVTEDGSIKEVKVSVYSGETYIKSFVKNITGKSYVTKDDVLDKINDSIFSILDTATKEQAQYDGKYGLIRLADNLSCGRFRSESTTRYDLYMFAVVFGMTWDPDNPDSETDIDKNLFKDYYTNNLMKYIIAPIYYDVRDKFRGEPTGQGINFKNFTEMIYLYYIAKDLDPLEKLRKANEMVERVKNCERKGISDLISTTTYIHSFTDPEKGLIRLSEEEFEKKICEQYDCSLQAKNNFKINPFSVQSGQNKASEFFESLVSEIEKSMEKPDYGIWFIDSSDSKSKINSDFIREIITVNNNDTHKTDLFITLIEKINSILILNTKTDDNNPELFNVIRPAIMSRTNLIKAFYYHYNIYPDGNDDYKPDGDDTDASGNNDAMPLYTNKSFKEVFDDYRSELNWKLKEANYQELNAKNIFDIVVVFSSYTYLNN